MARSNVLDDFLRLAFVFAILSSCTPEHFAPSGDAKAIPPSSVASLPIRHSAMDAEEWALIPSGDFEMGDHHDLGGAEHPSDEIPIHDVRIGAFYLSRTEVTNAEYCQFLHAAAQAREVTVRDGMAYSQNGAVQLCDTSASDPASSIRWDGRSFSLIEGRAEHPVVCVRWHGAAAYCNWLSSAEGLQPCYDPVSWKCDYAREGYRLPSEAEWEYAARGGHTDSYGIFPWGDEPNASRANWPNSSDPYESGPYPWTTPVGFYNGTLHRKTDYNWPGPQREYQTADGANGYGLYDVSGNVWEWVNDWYQGDYYAFSPMEDPVGPTEGQPMRDGKPYRVLRGGSWYNGQWGHGRVSNRNPSYYRGPDDPNHRWYHVGFRVARTQPEDASKVVTAHEQPASGRTVDSQRPLQAGSQDTVVPFENRRDRGPAANKFQGTDSNGDGTVSLDEYLFHEGRKFERIDSNSDGVISEPEMDANEARPDNVPPRRDQKFARTDTDANGAVSREEYLAGERIAFTRFDRNQDGRLTPDELTGGRQEPRDEAGSTQPPPSHSSQRTYERERDESSKQQVSLDIDTLTEGKVGLVTNTPEAFPGYTLFAPKHRTMTYLIDNDGRLVHEWTASEYEPGQAVHLLENGNLLRCCFTHARGFTRGGEGGRLEEYDWDDNLVWEFDYATADHMLHHDVAVMPNGNILALAVERKTRAQCLAVGFTPDMLRDDELFPDFIVEIDPVYPTGGTIVWEWHVWDHLIQETDSGKPDYGKVAEHPERIDINCNDRPTPAFWNHMNSIAYNPDLDQILLSVRGCNEIWVIDHSTSRKEAAGSAGGQCARGGDLLYRWGNPAAYNQGTSADRRLFDQHDAQWISPGYPGAGNILIFNNGLDRGYSSLEEIVPPMLPNRAYRISDDGTFGPDDPAWHFEAPNRTDFFSSEISGAQRLPNGNTLVCAGVLGVLFEVRPDGYTVWKYVNPVVRGGILAQGELPGVDERGHYLNAVFRVRRNGPDYPGLAGRHLVPGGVIELPSSERGKTGIDRTNTPPPNPGSRDGSDSAQGQHDVMRSLGYL